jgi:hypothetical protein
MHNKQTKNKQGRPRNDHIRQKVHQLHQQGMKQKEIAYTLGVSQPWVSNVLCNNPLDSWKDIESAPKDGRTILAAAKPAKLAIWGMGLSKWDGVKWTGFTKQDQPTRWMQAPMPPAK